jgi:hypothetical protein
MAITKFVPELWVAAVQEAFEKSLVYAQPSVANRNYEGMIRQMGDTVRVTTLSDPTVRTYDKTTDITTEDVTDGEVVLTIDQGKYVSFRVNDVDAVQAAGDFRGPHVRRAGYLLKDALDTFCATTLAAGVSGSNPDNSLGDYTAIDAADAWYVLRDLGVALDKASAPSDGRYVVVDPTYHALLLDNDRFVRVDASGTSEGLRNGIVGRALGFDILLSNNVPDDGYGKKTLIAGIPDAFSVAEQIVEAEALRSEVRFADIVRMLHIYGAKVFRGDGIATANVTTTLPT